MSFDILQLSPLSIILPFLGAALSLVLVHRNRAQRFVAIVSLSLTLLAECLVLATAWESAPTSINIAGWEAPFGIVLVVDQLSAIMLVVSTLVSLAVLLFATGQGIADGDDDLEVYSIESPLGSAIHGSKVGDTVDYTAPTGKSFPIEILRAKPYSA